MKILSRYVTGEFIKILLLISAGLVMLFMVVDVFENLGDLTRSKAGIETIIKFFILHVPQALYYVTPLAFLFASFINLALLSRHNEVIAMRSGGLNLISIILPELMIALAISVLVFFLNDSIIPVTNRMAEDIKRDVENRPRETFFKEDSLWLKSDLYTLYNIRLIDPDKNILWHVNIYHLTPDFQLKENIYAEIGLFTEEHWVLRSGVRRIFKDKGPISLHTFDRLSFKFPFDLEELKHAAVKASETRFTVLRRYIRKIRKEGYEVKRLTVDLYAKTAFPFITFITTLIGISMGLHSKRYGGIAGGTGICILVSILYWVFYSFSLNMGYSGQIPPIPSAWMANIVFIAIGGLMLYRAGRV